MGCDIHTFLEMKKTIDGEEVWVNIDPHIYCAYDNKLEHHSIADGRNYELFAVLAGVRNRQEVKPISEPKGIPDNCHKITMDDYKEWDCDAHTASWLTIKELKDYQSTASKEVKRSGLLNPEQYKRFSDGEEPESWCQGTNQPDYKYAEWTSECSPVDSFITEIYDYLNSVFWSHEIRDNDEGIRVVFWFDN